MLHFSDKINPACWASSAGQERRSLSSPESSIIKLNKPELTPDSLIPHLPAYRSRITCLNDTSLTHQP